MAGINAYDKSSYSQLNLPNMQELMAVPAYMQQQQDAALEQASMLQSEGDKVKFAAMENPDGIAAKSYQQYTNLLNEGIEDILNKGYKNSNAKRKLLEAKSMYQSQIAPIAMAWEQQKKDTALLQDIKLKDPTAIIDDDPSTRSIDAYLQNGIQSQSPKVLSGSVLMTMAAKMAEPLSKLDRNSAEYKSILGGQYFEKFERYGATPDEIAMAMADDATNPKSGMPKALRDIVNSVYESAGIKDYSPLAQQQALGYIASGLTSAIGTSKSNTVDNKNFMSDYQRAQISAKAEGSGSKADKDTFTYVGMTAIHPQFEKDYKDLTKALRYANDYIDVNGNLKSNINKNGNASEKLVAEAYELYKNEDPLKRKQLVVQYIADKQNQSVIKNGIAFPLLSATDQTNLLKEKALEVESIGDGILKRFDSSGVPKKYMDRKESARIIGEDGGLFGVTLTGETVFKSTNGEMYRVDPILLGDDYSSVIKYIVDNFNNINSQEGLTQDQKQKNIQYASYKLKETLSTALLTKTKL